jgi:putative NADH-flavin reductase
VSNVIVFGASGYAGGYIVDELLDRGHLVVGVARDVSQLPSRPNLTVRAGSVHDKSFVEDVVARANVDTIVVSVPAVVPDGPALAEVVWSMLLVAEKAGARLGIVGGCGSLYSIEDGPLVHELPEWPAEGLEPALAHARALSLLRNSDTSADWFYLSPPMTFDPRNPGIRRGTYRLGVDLLIRDAEGNSYISGADFAMAFADEIETRKHHNSRFTVGY